MIHCLRFDVFTNTIDMDFLKKVEVIKQYRQSVMISENFDSVTQKIQRLKITTKVLVYEKSPEFLYESYYL